MSVFFRDLTSPEIEAAAKAGALILLPLGQTEEHGSHLPVGTDTVIAENVCAETARQLDGNPQTLVLPPIHYGYSSKIMTRWTGTFTLPTDLVIRTLIEICKSVARMGFEKIVIVNAHGHHQHLAIVAAREVSDATGVEVAVLMPNSLISEQFKKIRKSEEGGACHGGEYETSLMLHFKQRVQQDQASNEDILTGGTAFCSRDMLTGGGKVFWSTWSRQASKSGIYGDPTIADAETGRLTMEAIVEQMVLFCREYHSFKPSSSDD